MARKEKTIYLDPNKYKWTKNEEKQPCIFKRLFKKWTNKNTK